jgi:hypothetical protein
MPKKLTRERLRTIIKEEKQRLKRIKEEARGGDISFDSGGSLSIEGDVTLTESDNLTWNGSSDNVGTSGDAWEESDTGMDRLQELAGVNEEPEVKKTVTSDTLEMMDEVRDTITDRRVLEQLAKTIDDDTFRDALREIAEEENIQLY